MKIKHKYFIRKAHRYLGLFLGIQFLLWTLGGLYFSWNNIDSVHGDHLLNERKYVQKDVKLISPETILNEISSRVPVDSLLSLQLIELFDKPVYQIRFFTGKEDALHKGHSEIKTQLADAATGMLLAPLNDLEAIQLAKKRIKNPGEIIQLEYLTVLGTHHEYRGRPLPAWAITFKYPESTTAYVAAELGTFQLVRHNQWRIFDFLWMLHTMDYQGRDNFGNILLKIFSAFGLITILSGFVLYFISSATIRNINKKNKINKN